MNKLGNYITGSWITGDGDGQLLYNAVTGEAIASATTKGLDFAAITSYARRVGNPALRKMTFHERGNMLKALALHLRNHLDRFYAISYKTGATKADSWVDIEGGIGNLFANASLRKKLPDESFCIDGESHNLGKQNTFMGHPYIGAQRRGSYSYQCLQLSGMGHAGKNCRQLTGRDACNC